MAEATPMPNDLKSEVVPIQNVPPPTPDHAVDGLEAWFVDDGKISDGSLGTLRTIEIAFEVRGLPPGQKSWIIQSTDKCQLVRQLPEGDCEWLGEFPDVLDALRALARKLH
jgi:hypothetical protein